jgi:hypothetical protein
MHHLGGKKEYLPVVKLLCANQIAKQGSKMLQDNNFIMTFFAILENWEDTYAASSFLIHVVFMTEP